jgi:hypothetical protein
VKGAEQSDGFWLGRLSMAVAVAPNPPRVARETLEELLKLPKPSSELRAMLREELKSNERSVLTRS